MYYPLALAMIGFVCFMIGFGIRDWLHGDKQQQSPQQEPDDVWVLHVEEALSQL